MPDNDLLTTPITATSDVSTPQLPQRPSRGSFWSRYSTLINFSLDAMLLVLFMLQAWILAVLHVVFPRGAGSDWTIWRTTPLDWSDAFLAVYCVFGFAIVLHVMFHWSWICGVVTTKFLRRKARKDDGSQTLIGVGLIVVLVHLLLAGILIAKVGLHPPA